MREKGAGAAATSTASGGVRLQVKPKGVGEAGLGGREDMAEYNRVAAAEKARLGEDGTLYIYSVQDADLQ